MKITEEGNTCIIEIPYKEWVVNPFPAPKDLKIDGITRYVITECPKGYEDELRKMKIIIDE